MKKMKKIAALLLAAVMVLGVSMTVFADDPDTSVQTTTGSISISNHVEGVDYEIYKVFDLISYNPSANAYVYKVTNDWKEFVRDDEKENSSIGEQYFELYDGDYVRLKEDVTVDAAELAQALLTYAEENNIEAVATLPISNSGSKSYTATGLDLGYYVVDSSLGALCSLTTIAPNSLLQEKNAAPTIEKKVLDDKNHNCEQDDEETWAEKNDANIGDTVLFKTIIHAKYGAHDYKVHDVMGVGLTLDKNSIKVMGGTEELTINEEYKVDCNVADKADDGTDIVCDFELSFTDKYLDSITEDTDIEITYSAVLNEGALIYEEGNINATRLDYGDNLTTEYSRTTTYTYMFDIVKTDENHNVLKGAEFKLYSDDACENEIALTAVGNGTYHVATIEQKDTEGFSSATIIINIDKVVIKGLANGTYYLKETKAPNGYNALTEPIEVVINGNNLKGSVENGSYDTNNSNNNAVHVINKSGSLLPETGGMGTTIIYIVGGILVVGAVVILVTRKRMNREA